MKYKEILYGISQGYISCISRSDCQARAALEFLAGKRPLSRMQTISNRWYEHVVEGQVPTGTGCRESTQATRATAVSRLLGASRGSSRTRGLDGRPSEHTLCRGSYFSAQRMKATLSSPSQCCKIPQRRPSGPVLRPCSLAVLTLTLSPSFSASFV